MQVAVLTSELLKIEIMQKGLPREVSLACVNNLQDLLEKDADVYMDLLFEKDHERMTRLATILPKPIFINAITNTLAEIGYPFIRLNAWPGFLKRNVLEIAVNSDTQLKIAASLLPALGWDFAVVPDEPGMVTGRVISMIVNEAYFALGDNVSTKNEIDIAMKLGTNYPYGPFEWSERIGLVNIYKLLSKLAETDERYVIAPAMTEEINHLNRSES